MGHALRHALHGFLRVPLDATHTKIGLHPQSRAGLHMRACAFAKFSRVPLSSFVFFFFFFSVQSPCPMCFDFEGGQWIPSFSSLCIPCSLILDRWSVAWPLEPG